jgi:hypothetical protein
MVCVACGSASTSAAPDSPRPAPNSASISGPAKAAATDQVTIAPPQITPSPSAVRPEAPSAVPVDGSLQQIERLIGAAACTDSSQCRSLALGAAPCGGPASYIAWSAAQNDEAPLRSLAERYQQEQRATNLHSGVVGICRMLTDPGAVCRAGTCQLGAGTNPAAQ